MAQVYKTPGVYIEEIPKLPASISPVETAIPAFIGYTGLHASGEPPKIARITSMMEYEQNFGRAQTEDNIIVDAASISDSDNKVVSQTFKAALNSDDRSKHIMYYALQMFFANGGGPCYIVSIGEYKTLSSALVEADFKAGLDAVAKKDEPTLIVFPEAQFLDIDKSILLYNDALTQCELLKDRFVIMDVNGFESISTTKSKVQDIIDNFRSKGVGDNSLKYGAAYAPNLETSIEYQVDDGKINVSFYNIGDDANAQNKVTKTLKDLKIYNSLIYESAKSAIRALPCILPPSSTIAGIYAAVDAQRGVWKAPANVSLNAVIKPTIEISNEEQIKINDDATTGKSVNAIRAFTGKGTLVWGARTLAGNDNEWRYVNVRRLFTFIEESTQKATARFVFEPNDANTWVRVQAMCENFLTVLWRQGALQGIKPEHAFYVSVGLGKTMTALDILEGRMIVEIGLAAVRPAEFIILRFSHKLAQS
jgi:phage tail sheath protein FI